MEKDIRKMRSQVEFYQANLLLVPEPQNAQYKPFLAQINKELFELTMGYKALEEVKPPPEKTLFGKASERERRETEAESNLQLLPRTVASPNGIIAQRVIQIGDKYQEKTEQAVTRVVRQVGETHKVAEGIIVNAHYQIMRGIDRGGKGEQAAGFC